MSRGREYSVRGVRDIPCVKGCNTCLECANLSYMDGRSERYCCSVKNKSVLNDRKFPYDNTRCKEFVSR